MKLGIGSYAYAWSIGVPDSPPPKPMSAFDLLDKAGELGVQVLQICDNLPLDGFSDEELDLLIRRAEELEIQVEVGTRGIKPDHLQRYLQLAARLHSSILRVVIDTADHQPSLEETIGVLRPMLPHFEQAGVCLAIENHDRFTARQFREIVETLDSARVGICLDTVNSFGALEGPESVVATLAPWVVNLHVKDFSIQRLEHQMGFVIEGCPAGQGRLDIPWLIGELQAADRDSNLILEQWPAPEETIEQTIAKEDRWARTSITYLRTLLTNGVGHDSIAP